MIKYFCEKCGKEISKENDRIFYEVKTTSLISPRLTNDEYKENGLDITTFNKHELCKSCAIKLTQDINEAVKKIMKINEE